VLWAGGESRGAEIKLPPGAGAANTNRGSGSFLLFIYHRLEEILLKKSMVAEEVLILILIVEVKKGNFQGTVSYQTNLCRSQSWSRSCNSYFWLRGAAVGAERNNFGSTTLQFSIVYPDSLSHQFLDTVPCRAEQSKKTVTAATLRS
jgi:hypothetical protein